MYSRLAALAAGVCLAASALPAPAAQPAVEADGGDLAAKAEQVRTYALENAMPAVLRHAARIASFGSRQTGQPGCDNTAGYIRDTLAEIGLENVRMESAPVTAAVAGDAWIVLPDGGRVEALAMVPNGVQPCRTPPEGLSGPLIYVGRGRLEDFGGRDLSGAIVLMDYNSVDNWLKTMEFGAKAAVFIEPDFTTWRQTDGKYIDHVPLYFPRVFVRKEDAGALLGAARGGATVTLHSHMALDNVDGKWVEGYLSGTAGTTATMNIVTHFDARSVAPALSPGGDELWGAAAFLELARYFHDHRPPVNIRFIAFSGNWQTHALSRLYVHNTLDRLGVEDRITCAIDLSTDGDDLAVDYNGLCHDAEGPRFKELKPILFGSAAVGDRGISGQIQSFFGKDHRLYGGMRALPHESEFNLADAADKRPLTRAPRFYTPNEAWEHARSIAFVFQTASLWRYLHNTPMATFERSLEKADNLKPQLVMLFYILDRLGGIVHLEENIPIEKTTYWQPRQTGAKGYADVKGRVRVFSVKTAWYDKALPVDQEGRPLGDTYLYVYPYDFAFLSGRNFGYLPWPLAPQRYWHQGMQSFMTRYIVKVDPDGSYFLPAVAAATPQIHFTFLAYTLDKDGRIIYATDYGLRGDVEYRNTDRGFFTAHMEVPVTVFPCGSLTLFGLDETAKFNYQNSVPNEWYIQWPLAAGDGNANEYAERPHLVLKRVMRAGARTEAEEYSFVQWKDVAMAFVKPEMPVEFICESPSKKAILNNSREATDSPPGYTVSQGENLPILFTPLALLEQLGYLNTFRLASYKRYGVRSYEAERQHEIADAYLRIARDAFGKRDYRKAVSSATLGVDSQGKAYKATIKLLWDVVSTTVFYFTLLIPFSFLTERLLFPQKTPSRTLVVSTAIFVIFVGLLWIFHPGFKLADNIWITIISFLIVILTLPALFLIVGRGFRMLKETGEEYFRSHTAEVERLGVLVAALSLAISNMRRRRLRTGLTLSTITLLILALVLLTTSTSFSYAFNRPRKGIETPNEGILVSNTYNRRLGLFTNVYEILKDLYSHEAIVAPREYYNYAYADTAASKRKMFLTKDGYSAPLPSLQILDENEPAVSGIDKAIISGRWFTAEDLYSIILPKTMASQLRAGVSDTVLLENIPLEVVGIFDGEYVDKNCLDPDGSQVTPLYFADPSQGDVENPAHFPADQICYLPRRFNEKTRLLTTAVWGVVIKPFDRERIAAIADSIALQIANVDVFKSYEGSVSVLSAYHKVSIKGSSFMIMPLVVAFFMVLAVMLGTVHERRREINIFSSVGLSPRHVAGMFFVESIVYAGIASVLGYFIGIIMLYVFRVAGLFPPAFYPNYLGVFVIYSVGLAMLATISSSVYPMYIAARIANPSLERTWRIDTEPTDGRWEIEFPFIASDIYEVLGITAFLKEYVEHFSGEGMGAFACLSTAELRREDPSRVSLAFSAWLAPFERNITQSVVFKGVENRERGRWSFSFDITYASGPAYLWLKSNKLFVDEFRKQMLIWRAFSDTVIEEYIQKGVELVGVDDEGGDS